MSQLFADIFPPADKAQWLAQVQKDLKDPTRSAEAVYESLRWQTPEGFSVEPYYTAEDLEHLPLETLQAAQKKQPGWLTTPELRVQDPKEDNATLRDWLSRGADALLLDGTNTAGTEADLTRLLNGIKLSETPVFFRFTGPATEWLTTLQRVAPYQLKGGFLNDQLARWTTAGDPYTAGLASVAEATRLSASSPQFRTITVSSHAVHNAGANATQELAFLLASLTDIYDHLTNAGLAVDQLAPKTVLSVSVGTSYFMEIAKLWALRILYQRLLAAYSPHASHPMPERRNAHGPCYIHAQTSTFYDATATPYTNLLRATTEAMAAVIGGCDALTVHPYDTTFRQPDEFSHRIARNLSILLKEESHLDKVADPAAGTYYLENLTNQLVEAAWQLFLAVEERGGFTKAFEQGFIQEQIQQAYQAKVDAVQNGRVLVGVTKFRFDEESVAKPDQPLRPLQANGIPLLPDRRLATAFE
ncbi:hypothetical protein GCM10023189_38100 [Nibrella saemangeumensis]|uniref:Methylmalonyl-CoA mutase alpha/beta chain catalytic domain-containing protein n=1 Tax=Nibrella saemangeumensis TaxID=1084526 RepID=A0ABP8N8Z8_9BACT